MLFSSQQWDGSNVILTMVSIHVAVRWDPTAQSVVVCFVVRGKGGVGDRGGGWS
jgi:hypothetical protein